jgi:2-oxoglutarate dehydrogenase E1 component
MDDTTKPATLRALWSSSQLAGGNSDYLDSLYEDYLRDPSAVDAAWRAWFESLPVRGGPDVAHAAIREQFRHLARATAPVVPAPAQAGHDADQARRQVRVLQLINAYRFRAHQIANLDPLGLSERPEIPELDLRHYGLTDSDLDMVFEAGSLVGPRQARLADILDALRRTYAGTIGAEYMHITDTQEKRWIQSSLESVRGVPAYQTEVKRRLLERLTAAEGLEHYLHTKYVGQKRFSLEGGESLIPLLDELIQRAGAQGVREIVMGMAHRGRLNVLVNILGKSPADLFREFEGKRTTEANGSGDVKYHMGFSSDVATPGGPVHLALAFNPSHLEIVAPVVQGSVRARQDRRHDRHGRQVLPVVMHGDAAFAGQGVVMETFNMALLRGYSTRGTVHVVINNQIGFTTSLSQDARSTLYCTDVARMVNAPIFHVNGDDPEAVMFVTQIALDYRMTFHKDVVIDLVCYRRHGHSEADEPTVTQPIMYRRIHELPTTRARYAQRLVEQGEIEPPLPAELEASYVRTLDAGECAAPALIPKYKASYPFGADWSPYLADDCSNAETRLELDSVRALSEAMLTLPEGFEPHPNVARLFDNRRKMAAGALPLDWGYAENLAYAALLQEGYSVRVSGQDSGRGTFFHRHAILHGYRDGGVYVPLRNLCDSHVNFLAINSPLSEEAVLAFEYGYATADPKTLTIWEAQFGDFANNAQVVIDQFISAGEQKWGRRCGLTLFLPHGFEGQGPEHSSARLERYLQLCAQHNLFVVAPTTPAQFFHLLRRQMRWLCRKPLIVMTPKSLLRHRLSVSSLEDITRGAFQPLLPEADTLADDRVERVVLCAGKVYFDALEKRRELKIENTAILRVEQLYPFPEDSLRQELARYPQVREMVWCQEEPQNQGAWFASQHHMRAVGGDLPLRYAGRAVSASPAAGSHAVHVREQHALVAEALGIASK